MQEPNSDKCQSVFELLDAYLDTELSTEEAAAVEAHLAECGDCSERLRELKSLVEKLNHLPEVPMPRDLSSSIEAKIAALSAVVSTNIVELPSGKNVMPFPVKYAALCAVAAAVLFFVIGNFSHTGKPALDNPPVEASKPQSDLRSSFHLKQAHEVSPVTLAGKPEVQEAATAVKAPETASNKAASGEVPAEEVAVVPGNSEGEKHNSGKEGKHSLESASGGDLIAEYSELSSDGSEDYGISTNEDGLYAIKL
jgi:anti-sigma factor RsiW